MICVAWDFEPGEEDEEEEEDDDEEMDDVVPLASVKLEVLVPDDYDEDATTTTALE